MNEETDAGAGSETDGSAADWSVDRSLSADEAVEVIVESRAHGWRVDHYLSRLFPNYSRVLFKKAILAEAVLLNGLPVKTSRRLRVNDHLSVRLPKQPDESLPAEDIPIDVLYEDDALIAVNKSADMVVHPGKANYGGTLASALQFHFDSLSDMAGRFRPGIVHRLDRNTTGVILIAKDNQVHHQLSGQFERREVSKEYRAICHGVLNRDRDFIETHLRTHPKKREKMCVCQPGGKSRDASTFYEVLERFDAFSYVRLRPKTGRTHQLRVHMQHLGHPIVADSVYGGGSALYEGDSQTGFVSHGDQQHRNDSRRRMTTRRPHPNQRKEQDIGSSDALISRQALHAFRIEFSHPRTGKLLALEAPLPEDMERTLSAFR